MVRDPSRMFDDSKIEITLWNLGTPHLGVTYRRFNTILAVL